YYEDGGDAVARLEWSSASQAREVVPQSQLFSIPAPIVLATPNGVAAATVSTSRINVSWSDPAGDASVFRVERSTDGNHFVLATVVEANTFQFSDQGLAAGTTYTYRVQAVSTTGVSAYSSTAVATTDANPVPPPVVVPPPSKGTPPMSGSSATDV